jgi:hypothetical protein
VVNSIVWSPDNKDLFILRFAYPTTYLSIVNIASATMDNRALSDDYSEDIAVVYSDN